MGTTDSQQSRVAPQEPSLLAAAVLLGAVVLVLVVLELVVLVLVVLVLVLVLVVLVLVLVEVVGPDVVVVVVEPGPVWARAVPGTSVATKTAVRTPITAVGAVRLETPEKILTPLA